MARGQVSRGQAFRGGYHDFTIKTVPDRFARLGDLHATIDDRAHSLDTLLEWADRDERAGLADRDDEGGKA